MHNDLLDVVIIGGSYAGLAAAMSLGRAMRHVLIIDSGTPCNRYTPRSHNFLTRDGEVPERLIALAKAQVLAYPTITFSVGRVVAAEKSQNFFCVTTEAGLVYRAKKILFSTGLRDSFPDIEGFTDCWGISVLHCPYCHGYEVRGQKVGLLEHGSMTYEFIKLVSQWAPDLVVFTEGKPVLSDEQRAVLSTKKIKIIDRKIYRIQHHEGKMNQVVIRDGDPIDLSILYAKPPFQQQCDLAIKLGCKLNDEGLFETNVLQQTCVPGVYVAGDNSSHGRALSVVIAAGAVAGMYLNKEITDDEWEL